MAAYSPYAVSPPQPADAALTCPWCNAKASPNAEPQSCAGCGRRFLLRTGAALDASATPPQAIPGRLRIKWASVVTYCFAELEPMGIASGTLDPVVALAALDKTEIAYGDVISIALWRTKAWMQGIVGVLIAVPIALGCAVATVSTVSTSAGAAVTLGLFTIVFGATAARLIRHGLIIGRRRARIVGRWRSMIVQFDANAFFCEQLFQRCGLPPPTVP